MSKFDWIIAIVLIGAGLSCLTMASTGMMPGHTMGSSIYELFTICIFTALPPIALGIVYIYRKRKK